jgi:succinate dehydrogenase/fumarate reductase iron-sulfur protein
MVQLKVGDPIRVSIKKYDPSRDGAPYLKTYTVPYTREMRVLEALDYIVEELGESLAYQWFCGVKKCGMCGVMVNGRQKLGCWEPVEPEMLIEPLANFAVVRDLVIDRSRYFSNLMALQPALQRGQAYPGFPEPLTGTSMQATGKMLQCIECMLCVSACPAQGVEFMGPAPMVQLARFALDPRDAGPRGETARAVGGLDHCVSCRQCSRVCPMGIPVFETAIEGLRERARSEGVSKPRTLRDRLFGHIHALNGVLSRLPRLSNWVLGFAPFRWLLEKIAGVDRRRPLPRFAAETFDRWFAKHRSGGTGRPQVLLFHDTFMTYYEPEIGVAATELLEAAGFQVSLIADRRCCGRPMLSKGFIAQATANAGHNLRLLLPYAERGVPIIGCEPSCLLTIREDYPKLVPGESARKVAAQTFTLEEFLAEQSRAGKLRLKFTQESRKLLVHGHCHQKALVGMAPSLSALRLPRNYEVNEIPTTCCGMAGSNGFERENYERSMQAAEVSLLPSVRQAADDVEIVAAGISCRQQIRHGTTRQARHPALVLRNALLG